MHDKKKLKQHMLASDMLGILDKQLHDVLTARQRMNLFLTAGFQYAYGLMDIDTAEEYIKMAASFSRKLHEEDRKNDGR